MDRSRPNRWKIRFSFKTVMAMAMAMALHPRSESNTNLHGLWSSLRSPRIPTSRGPFVAFLLWADREMDRRFFYFSVDNNNTFRSKISFSPLAMGQTAKLIDLGGVRSRKKNPAYSRWDGKCRGKTKGGADNSIERLGEGQAGSRQNWHFF